MHEKIIILDFGGQYAHLIASRIRRENVLAEIHNPDEIDMARLKEDSVKGIIFSGGPQSVFDPASPRIDTAIFTLGKPILGICYGHQFIAQSLGGAVMPGEGKEYGAATFTHTGDCPLFAEVQTSSAMWMSHGDEVTQLPEGFQNVGGTEDCPNGAVWDSARNIFGIQFHPEVTHSKEGTKVLHNFLQICQVSGDWTMEEYYEDQTLLLKQKIGDRKVVLFVSGGVDSTVAFALLVKILGPEKVQGLLVDTGMMREGEIEMVKISLEGIGASLDVIEARDIFLTNLKGVYDPEEKRSIIGNSFLEVQAQYFEDHKLGDDVLLAQGTIYPDTIETGGTKNSKTIKTHHNRVPEIQKLIDEGKVIEPLADLYKDEVRALGEHMGLPHDLVWRHPFPGPGLGVRILASERNIRQDLLENNDLYWKLPVQSVGVQGDFRTYRSPGLLKKEYVGSSLDLPALQERSTKLINENADINRVVLELGSQSESELETVSSLIAYVTPERVETLQRADSIVSDTLYAMGLYDKVWQFPVVLVPLIFNDKGLNSIVLRPVDSIDAMSASVGVLPLEFFIKVTNLILEDPHISAVLLDITSKPPGTIEWE